MHKKQHKGQETNEEHIFLLVMKKKRNETY